MTAYQFIHIESVSLTGRDTYRKVNGQREVAGHISVDSVLGEAGRLDGYISHIEKVLEPVILYGDNEKGIEAVREKAQKWLEETTDSRGHKMRQDANCLLSGVISWPPILEKEGENEYFNRMKDFEAKMLIALKEKYGEDLVLVLRHDDEPFKGLHAGQIHYHWHFFCVKKPGEKFDLHPGFKARAEFNISRDDRKKLTKDELKEKNDAGMKAYKEAMIAYQDWFNTVCKEFNLERYGPMRIRIPRYVQVELEKYIEKKIKEANDLKADAESIKTEAEKKLNEAEKIKTEAVSIKKETESIKAEAESMKEEAENIKAEAVSIRIEAERIMSEAISKKNEAIKQKNEVDALKIQAEKEKIKAIKTLQSAEKEASTIIQKAEKKAEEIKNKAWVTADNITKSAETKAKSIIDKAKNFINKLLEEVEKLQGGKAVVNWAKTFMKTFNLKIKEPTSEKIEEKNDLETGKTSSIS